MIFVNDSRIYDNVVSSCHLYGMANSSIVKYPHKLEFTYRYNEYFVRRRGLINDDNHSDRSRKFIVNAFGVIEPKSGNVLFSRFLRSREQSRRRALDNSYRYALSNDWSYFCTFTFDPKKIDVHNDGAIVYAWKIFRQRLQYRYPDVKIYCVPERHKSGSLHFHALLGNVDLSDVIIPAYHDDKPVLTSFGDTVYNFSEYIFDFGFTTVVSIRDGSRERVVNYLVKYVNKSGSVSFNCKSFYHTSNLDKASKISAFASVDELFDILSCNAQSSNDTYFVNVRKNTDDYIVFDVTGDFLSVFDRMCCSNDLVNIN